MIRILEQVRRCQFCGSDMTSIPFQEYREDPFCNLCLSERVSAAQDAIGQVHIVDEGEYNRLVRSISVNLSESLLTG